MEPFAPSMEKLLLKNLPHLKRQDLDEYASLSTKRLTLFTHWRFALVPRSLLPRKGALPLKQFEKHRNELLGAMAALKEIESDIFFRNTTFTQHAIIKAYEATHAYWAARRRFALEQGNLVQLPYSFNKLKTYASAAANYRAKQISTLWGRWYLRLVHWESKSSIDSPSKVHNEAGMSVGESFEEGKRQK